MSRNGQGKKNSWRSGKSQWISLLVREKLNVWKKSGESEILRVHINLLFSLYFLILLFSNIKILLYVSQT